MKYVKHSNGITTAKGFNLKKIYLFALNGQYCKIENIG